VDKVKAVGYQSAAVRPRPANRHLGGPANRRRVRGPGALIGLVVLVGAGTAVLVASATGGTPQKPPGPRRAASALRSSAAVRMAARALPAAEAGLFPWQLQAPISREVVLPLGGGEGSLLVAGGLTLGGSSASGTYRLNTATGHLTLVGNLSSGLHDAASTVVGGEGLVLGGGAAVPTALAQAVAPGGTSRSSGQLPQARADAAAVTVGGVAYLVGGYNGTAMTPQVLATTDGVHYHSVATLAVPVRYPAVAATGGHIYVFGGQGMSGQLTRVVQVVDPATGTAKVIAQLPRALSAAAAGTLDGTIYLAGGLAAAGQPAAAVYAFDPVHRSLLQAGALPVAVANAGVAVSGGKLFLVGGETTGGRPSPDVQFVRPDRAFGAAGSPGAGSPFYGDRLLIADRGNDRLLLLDSSRKVLWSYPAAGKPAPPGGFYFPDDAFFIRHGTAIISNQEENDTVIEIAYPSGRLIFSYGHPKTPGSAPGYLNTPDDAYLLRNGYITVADPMNCRVLVINPANKAIVHQLGTTGKCVHNPPADMTSPNGDTPLADGNILVSEITGSWVDEYTLSGRLVWDVQLPSVGYPSDPQQIGPDRYLIADYESPGAIVEFNRAGQVLYRYQPTSGPGELNHPSLVELLPSGVFMMNDDYNDRIVAIDPATGATVWQYGQTGVAGTGAGLLNAPDGFDLLGPGGTTPTHPATG
jgi:outer membrane protein assembly factor BamB